MLVLGALVVFTVIILFAANQITSSVDEARGEDPRLRAAIVERIKPVGTVNIAGAAPEVAETGAAAERSGEQVAVQACNACHVAGVLGAPKIGDSTAWSQRLTALGGLDALTTSAINGKGNMPARGGAQVSDAEIRAAVEYMLAESGVEVAGDAPEPATPEPAVEADSADTIPASVVETAKDMAETAVSTATSMVAAVTPQAPPAAAPPATTAAPVAAQPMVPAAPTAAVPSTAPPIAVASPAAAPATTADLDLAQGKTIYDSACFACHATGAAGAPKLGDKALWAPRIAKGMEVLNTSALKGLGVMPAKGGRLDLADADVISAVAYMVEQAK